MLALQRTFSDERPSAGTEPWSELKREKLLDPNAPTPN